jgi:hypothetical protein
MVLVHRRRALAPKGRPDISDLRSGQCPRDDRKPPVLLCSGGFVVLGPQKSRLNQNREGGLDRGGYASGVRPAKTSVSSMAHGVVELVTVGGCCVSNPFLSLYF